MEDGKLQKAGWGKGKGAASSQQTGAPPWAAQHGVPALAGQFTRDWRGAGSDVPKGPWPRITPGEECVGSLLA